MARKPQAPRPPVVVPSADDRRDVSDAERERVLRAAAPATATELGRQAAVGPSLMVEPLDVRPSSEGMGIAHARSILGRDAVGRSDAEVLEACRQAETLAQLLVDMFLGLRGQERSR